MLGRHLGSCVSSLLQGTGEHLAGRMPIVGVSSADACSVTPGKLVHTLHDRQMV